MFVIVVTVNVFLSKLHNGVVSVNNVSCFTTENELVNYNILPPFKISMHKLFYSDFKKY